MVDFTDGVAFCNLLEIISAKKLTKWNAKPRIKAQKLENAGIGLQFLHHEGIKLVGIGNEDIVEPKRKLILGLIWTIILRYQIQRGESDDGGARSELLKWVRSKIPEYDIKNFANDWTSGKAICALAEAVEPGQMKLPQDFKNDPLTDATMGMTKAEENMGIPQVLHPSDMVGEPDELSNMTYISYFRDYDEKRGQRDMEEKIRRTPVADQCRAYGPGLESGEALIPGLFVIEARNNRGELIPMGGFPFTAVCKDPTGKFVGVQVKDNSDGTLEASYTPQVPGTHTVEVLLSGQHIGGANGYKKSPFQVPIGAAQVDASKCQMYGPGLEHGNVGHKATFTIKVFNRFGTPIASNDVKFNYSVVGPNGVNPKGQHLVGGKVPGEFEAEYLPILHGDHVVTVTLGGAQVAQSPVTVPIDRDPNASDPAQSWAEHLNDPTTIEPVKMRIHAVRPDGKPVGRGGEPYDAEVTDPHGNVVPAKVKDNGDGTYDVEIDAQEAGPHHVDLFLRNKDAPAVIEHVKDFPKTIEVEPGVDARQTLVHGPGLENGILDTHPQHFDVEYRDKHGRPLGAKGAGMPPKVEIKGPNGPVVPRVVDNGDGTYRVDYVPITHGNHDISVTLDKVGHLADSTYHVQIDAGAFAGSTLIKSYSFVVESRTKDNQLKTVGGESDNFKVTISGTGNPKAKLDDLGDGTYMVSYSLPARGRYTVEVKLNGANIQGSPFDQSN